MRRNTPVIIKKPESMYLTKNKYITRELVMDLTECMKYLRMNLLSEYMGTLGRGGTTAWDDDGFPMTMSDLESLLGTHTYGYKSGSLWFYAGPERVLMADENIGYKIINSTALNWCIDSILHEVNENGYDIFRTLEIPL